MLRMAIGQLLENSRMALGRALNGICMALGWLSDIPWMALGWLLVVVTGMSWSCSTNFSRCLDEVAGCIPLGDTAKYANTERFFQGCQFI